jgi:hypothetical protein
VNERSPRPDRVRVSAPRQRASGGPPQPRRRQIDEETRLGEIYLGSLLREQLRLAGLVLLALAVAVGGLPLLFSLVPSLTGVRVVGVPLPWLLLGVLVYPFLVLLGWLYVRTAERNESDFADLVETVDGP